MGRVVCGRRRAKRRREGEYDGEGAGRLADERLPSPGLRLRSGGGRRARKERHSRRHAGIRAAMQAFASPCEHSRVAMRAFTRRHAGNS
eukprot:2933678-Prymnesium_polylepis.1